MDKQKTALVLIDMQKESQFGIDRLESATNNAASLLRAFRHAGIPVYFTRHINRGDASGLSDKEPLDHNGEPVFYSSYKDNHEVLDALKPEPDEPVVDKFRWSSFFQTTLHDQLQRDGIENLVIGGFVTDGCLMTSVFDAYFYDYNINLVEDMCGASNEGAHMSAVLTMCNWIYNMSVFRTEEVLNWVEGRPYEAWHAAGPDTCQFTPETLRETYNRLIESTKRGALNK
ncbi:cysteine hydrolase family protein [Alkalicoccus chagannorensis]|uniref:cysteine hydrolase family protein n=1 Tax=Alkalicoccus chagannorensis TaxID=427072 RepID=UPI00040FE91A|nr:isochorismatase family cysteine hydrolase [Alkalicoccus chagannorensis]